MQFLRHIKHHHLFSLLLLFVSGRNAEIRIDAPNLPAAHYYSDPLEHDGSDFPCKGFDDDSFNQAAQYQAGAEYEIALVGPDTHGGGSCQFSLSYDRGNTFKVIKSIIGSCPLRPSYTFTIPVDAPAGKALFAWTWFNRVGDRQMYMNCAQVMIVQTANRNSSSLSMNEIQTEKYSQTHHGVPFDDFPSIFIANINRASSCRTLPGVTVVFPDPGPVVEYGDGVGYVCSPSNTTRPSTYLVGSETASWAPATPEKPFSTPKQPFSKLEQPLSIASSHLTSSHPPPRAQARSDPTTTYEPTTTTADSCRPGSFKCDSNSSYSLCSDGGRYLPMGQLPIGMQCRDNLIKVKDAP